jgi:hypothetical protein
MFLSFPSQPACPPLLSPTGSPLHAHVHRLPPPLPRVAGHHDTTVAACPCRTPSFVLAVWPPRATPSLHFFFPCFVKEPSSAPLASHPHRASCPIPSTPPPHPTHPYLALPFLCTGGRLPLSDCIGSPLLSPALVAATFTHTLSSLSILSHGSPPPPPSRGAAEAARGRRRPLWELISGRKHQR